MSTRHLNRMFNPKAVALIGAGSRENSAGRMVMRNLASGGFEGMIYHVNPRPGSGNGGQGGVGLQHLPDEIDLAVVAASIDEVPDILAACAQKRMGGAVIVSSIADSRFEASDNSLISTITDISKQSGLRVIGPDSVGIVNTAAGLNASLMGRMPVRGNIAFLSQNSDVCTSVLDMAMREHVGFSHFVSLGAMPDVCFADLIDFFGSAYPVGSIVMALERFSEIRTFMSAARAVSRVKPIIALKSDRTGQAGPIPEDRIWSAAFKRAGILRVNDFGGLFDCAEFLSKQKRPKGPCLAVITNTEGIGIMARDAMADLNLVPVAFTDDTQKKIAEQITRRPLTATRGFIPASSRKAYVEAVRICMDAPEVDGLLLLSSPFESGDAVSLARELAALVNVTPCPVLTAWMGGLEINSARTVFNRAGIATYETPERAVKAFAHLYRYGRNIDMLQQIPVRTDKRLEINYPEATRIVEQGMALSDSRLPDDLAKALISAYGIPVGQRRDAEIADYELFAGAIRHPAFGPVLRFGMGGAMTDVFNDTALALPPLNRHLARAMIEDTRASRLLDGSEGIPGVDRAVLEEMMIRISRLITDFPAISRLELNPIQVCRGHVAATHGRIDLETPPDALKGRLIISPYPFWQETRLTVKGDRPVFVRPVRPADAPKMIDLFEELSPETVYLRFFSPIKEISRPMLVRLTQIDYDREIALLAFSGSKADRRIVGVARIIFMLEQKEAEFAIVLADAWQGGGLGGKLLHHALACTKRYPIVKVWGPVMKSNKGMLKMGKKLGFDIRRDMDSGEYKLTISLDRLPPGPAAFPSPEDE